MVLNLDGVRVDCDKIVFIKLAGLKLAVRCLGGHSFSYTCTDTEAAEEIMSLWIGYLSSKDDK